MARMLLLPAVWAAVYATLTVLWFDCGVALLTCTNVGVAGPDEVV